MIVLFTFSLQLIILHYEHQEEFHNKVEQIYYSGVTILFIVILYFAVISSFFVGFSIANLIGLHIWLKIHHLTTYEHICKKRARKKESKQLSTNKIKDSTDPGTSNISENISVSGYENIFYTHMQVLKSSKPLSYNHDNIFSHDSNVDYSYQPEINDSYHTLDMTRNKVQATEEDLARSPALKELDESLEHDLTFDDIKV